MKFNGRAEVVALVIFFLNSFSTTGSNCQPTTAHRDSQLNGLEYSNPIRPPLTTRRLIVGVDSAPSTDGQRAKRSIVEPSSPGDEVVSSSASDYQDMMRAMMKRQMSMLRLRRAMAAMGNEAGVYWPPTRDANHPMVSSVEGARDIRAAGGPSGGPMNRMTMLRLRRLSRAPSMLRLKRVTQMRLKKAAEQNLNDLRDEDFSVVQMPMDM